MGLESFVIKRYDHPMRENLNGLLSIDTQSSRVFFEGKTLELQPKWVHLIALMMLKKLERAAPENAVSDTGSEEVRWDEVHLLPSWAAMKPLAVRTSIFAFVEKQIPKGLDWIASPPKKATQIFFLDPARVKRVKSDVAMARLRTWLFPPAQQPELNMGVRTVYLLTRAQILFDKGMFVEVLELAEEVLALKPEINCELHALSLMAWAKLYVESRAVAWAAVERMSAVLEHGLRDQAAGAGGAVLAQTQGMVWVQVARFHAFFLEAKKAEQAVKRAELVLEPGHSFELGAVAFVRGYMAQKSNNLELAEDLYGLALDHYRRARWWWGVSSQMNNIGVTRFLRYEASLLGVPDLNLLHSGIQVLKDSYEMSRDGNINGSANQELNLSYAYRVLGDLVQVGYWLKKGSHIVNVTEGHRDRGEFFAERAEFELLSGDRAGALQSFELAVHELTLAGTEDWLRQVRQRMDGLKRRLKSSKPLKLW
jgi:tetratricopeptide (TPR) repeat protein